MSKFILLFFPILLIAQTPPKTPNIGLYLPPHGSYNWDTWINANSSTLDTLFGPGSGAGSVVRIGTDGFIPMSQLPYTPLGLASNVLLNDHVRAATPLIATEYAGADIGAQINAAVTYLKSQSTKGGIILVPAGSYTFSTPIDVSNTFNITLAGVSGAANAGVAAPSQLVYTGTTSIILANQTTGFRLTNLQIMYKSTVSGSAVDFSHGAFTFDSVFGEVDHCNFLGITGGTVTNVINVNKAIVIDIHDNNLNNATNGVLGIIAASGDYSNVISVHKNHFSSSTGTITGSLIANPGQSWSILNNAFEMGTAAGVPKAISCSSTSGANGVDISANWIGDWTNGTTGTTDIEVCGGAWNIHGNEIAAPFTGAITIIDVKNGTWGLSVTGNRFDTNNSVTDFNWGTNVANVLVAGNMFGSVTNFQNGAPLSGIVTDNNGVTNVYGTANFPGTIKSGANTGVTNNFSCSAGQHVASVNIVNGLIVGTPTCN